MRLALSIATLLVNGALFAATPIDGWYSSAFGGYTYLPNNLNKTKSGLTFTNANYQSGFDAGGSLGFKSSPMRYEGEVTYLKADINNFNINHIRQTNVNGYDQTLLGMANVYYDFPGFIAPVIQPFLGIGIGYAWIQANLNNTGSLYPAHFRATNSAFAYQATGGFTYNFAENYALNLGYRYIGTSNVPELGRMFQAHLANVGAIYRFDGNNYK